MMFGTEHIHGYRSDDEDDIVYVTVNQRDRTLYASARVKKRTTRLQVTLSAFETPDGDPVYDNALSRRVQKWVRNSWATLPVK